MMLEENNIVFLKKKITKNRLTGSTIFIQISKSEFLEPTITKTYAKPYIDSWLGATQ